MEKFAARARRGWAIELKGRSGKESGSRCGRFSATSQSGKARAGFNDWEDKQGVMQEG